MTNQIVHPTQTITSAEVAEMVSRNHADVMRDIRNIIEHLNESKIALVNYFSESSYRGGNGQERPMYLLTKKGCELYSTRMTGAKGTAFAVAYIERFNQMEQAIQNNLPTDPLELALTAALETRKEVAEIRQDVAFLKDNMRINTYQEKVLQDIVKRKALNALGGKKTPAYEMLSKKVFASAWRDFKNHFGISTYKELPVERFNEGIELLNLWSPSASLQLEIAGYNKQMAWESDM